MKKLIGYIEKHVVAILIVFLIWLAIVVFGVAPLALATVETAARGGTVVELMQGFGENLVTFDSFFKVFNASNGASVFIKQIGLFTIFYIGCVIYVGCQKDDAALRQILINLFAQGDPVFFRHVDIQNGDIRRKIFHLGKEIAGRRESADETNDLS